MVQPLLCVYYFGHCKILVASKFSSAIHICSHSIHSCESITSLYLTVNKNLKGVLLKNNPSLHKTIKIFFYKIVRLL